MNLKPELLPALPRRTVLYPVFLKLEDRRVLVVGGGKVAEEKLDAVLRSAIDVTVVAPEVTPRIAEWVRQGVVRWLAEEYREGMVLGYFLVITCTDSVAVNHQVFEECRRAGILCNAVDDPDYCDFYTSSVVRRGDLQIAISTGGSSPALAQRLRKQMEREFGPEYGPWVDCLGRMRTALRLALPRNQRTVELLHLLAACRPGSDFDKRRENKEVASMSREFTQPELAGRIREVLKEHQREGLNMIGNVDKLVNRLAQAVHGWMEETEEDNAREEAKAKKSA
ncbi:MAG TPA: bifunctional precorrin-2 dehydrogenase/sirohydrochlorin ferrochelatase [Candidatus Saccharimonadales bacterium]|jgi:precorrin-2 dehydrogenase/sirohydrochlorin ferrochelatase|nr:bifunctional precorrin-2 dehydrogenase/sirohydrochlorin ferrochelatase [Candidatus Saccharimonadales bacterium]